MRILLIHSCASLIRWQGIWLVAHLLYKPAKADTQHIVTNDNCPHPGRLHNTQDWLQAFGQAQV